MRNSERKILKMQENEDLQKSVDHIINSLKSMPFMDDVNDVGQIKNWFETCSKMEMMEHCIKYMKFMYSECLKISNLNMDLLTNLTSLQVQMASLVNLENIQTVATIMDKISEIMKRTYSDQINPYVALSCVMISFCKNPPDEINTDHISKQLAKRHADIIQLNEIAKTILPKSQQNTK